MIRGFEWDYGVKVRLVDTSGLVQVDSDEKNIEQIKLDNLNLSKDAEGDFIYQDTGDGSFVVTKYVENLKCFLVVQSDGLAETGQFANVILVNVLMCLLVMAAPVVPRSVLTCASPCYIICYACTARRNHGYGHCKRAVERMREQGA